MAWWANRELAPELKANREIVRPTAAARVTAIHVCVAYVIARALLTTMAVEVVY